MIGTSIKCPFLEEIKMAYCKAYPIKKMIPVASIKENPCVTPTHFHCPIYEEGAKDSVTFHILSISADSCPFFEESNMMYCKVYPIKKMIPISAMQLESCCTKEAYHECDAYLNIAEGDKTVRVKGFLMKSDLSYHEGHTWLKREKDKVKVGFDDFASQLLGNIEKVELPVRGEQVKVNNALLKVKCGGYIAEPSSPLSGTVVEVNECLLRNPNLIQRDPYGQGWLFTIAPSGNDERSLSGIKAQEWLDKEIDRFHSLLEREMGVTLTDGGEMIRDLHERLSINEWNRLIKAFLRPEGGI